MQEKIAKGGESSGECVFIAFIKSMFSGMLFSLMPLPVMKRQINRDWLNGSK